MGFIQRKCDNCPNIYLTDIRNLNRGWGLCCSKSCAASKREKSKRGYDSEVVKANNIRRENWNDKLNEEKNDYDPGDSEYWDNKDYGL